MTETKETIEKIVKGIQEKKGSEIKIVDLTSIKDTICEFFIICQGYSTTQISAIVDSVKDETRKVKVKPIATDGANVAEWVAIDYANIMVHVFLPEVREYYNLESLWADAKITEIPDLD